MKTLILTAMDIELEACLSELPFKKEKNSPFHFWRLQNSNCEILISPSGVGPLAATATTTELAHFLKPDHVLLLGVCGSLSASIPPLSTIIADSIIQHDATYDSGHNMALMRPGSLYLSLDPTQRPSPALSTRVPKIKPPFETHIGVFACGASFAGDLAAKQKIRSKIPTALGVDMESAGVAYACERLGIGTSVIKVCADGFSEQSPVEYLELKMAAAKSAAFWVKALTQSSTDQW